MERTVGPAVMSAQRKAFELKRPLLSRLYGLFCPRPSRTGSTRRLIERLFTLERVSPGDFEITFIDPHPERLKYLVNVAADARLRLIERQVQDISSDVFTSLRPGDLMFMDSSHVMKYRSDLYILMFDVLPRLPAGVHVLPRAFDPLACFPETWRAPAVKVPI
jgi:hypothetical protein